MFTQIVLRKPLTLPISCLQCQFLARVYLKSEEQKILRFPVLQKNVIGKKLAVSNSTDVVPGILQNK